MRHASADQAVPAFSHAADYRRRTWSYYVGGLKIVGHPMCEKRDSLIVGYLNSQSELSKLVAAVGQFGFNQEAGVKIEGAEQIVATRLRALVDHCRDHGC